MKNFIFLFCFATIMTSCGLESTEGDPNATDGVGADEHRIFVSSSETDGNMGGLAGADDICEGLAEEAGLVRTYRALLSDEESSAERRLDFTGAIYVVSGAIKTLVAGSETDLFGTSSANLTARVNQDESGSTVPSANVWTGTNSEGGILADETCESWTSDSGDDDGFTGSVDQFDDRWIEDSFYSCNNTYRIYCVSQ